MLNLLKNTFKNPAPKPAFARRLCRSCGENLQHSMIDLGMSPPSNRYLKPHQLTEMEPYFPLHAYVCHHCWLVQLEQFQAADEIFAPDYAYFSSYSDSWLAHCERYSVAVADRFKLGPASLVVEVASNDGYLLQYFQQKKIPVLGIEPANSVAQAAMAKGIPTQIKFFGVKTARELKNKADLLIGNNVLAHVPDLNDFVAGLAIALKNTGVITIEFPHLLKLIEENQFDTIYHEHFCYFSLLAVQKVFARHGLDLFDVEELPTHGGSLRIYGCHKGAQPIGPRIAALLSKEKAAGLDRLETYHAYRAKVERTKRALLQFLIKAKEEGKTIVGYGAAAKGNTLLNYCGIRQDFIDYTVDLNPHKQGQFLPGTHIPIYPRERIAETKPDYILILPWNIKDEVMRQMAHIRDWGAKFVVPIPEVKVLD